MKRREFMTASLSVAGAVSMRSLRAQPTPSKRGAVVIGVDKVGTLQPLAAARSGARAVAAWLTAEGFEVKLFVDDPRPVRANDLFEAVNAFVKRGTLDQLVVYFAGHGFVKGTQEEFGLLSGSLDNPNEAVNLSESEKYAWQSGIKNVVLISDACRSRSENLQTDGIRGLTIFPSGEDTNVQLDRFFATRIGTPAFEAKLKGSNVDPAGIYTDCLLDAFKRPYASTVKVVGGKSVVPNRLLPDYLEREVPYRARQARNTLEQHPFAHVCSADVIYMGQVSGQERLPERGGPPTDTEVVNAALTAAFAGRTPRVSEAFRAVAESSGFDRSRNTIVQARSLTSQLPMRTGFVIVGQRVEIVTTKPGVKATLGNSADGGRPSAKIEVDVRDSRAASVVLRFADGTGTVVAALDTYIGEVVVDDGRVVSVSYVPSEGSPMGRPSGYESTRLAQLHSVVGSASQFGVFRIDGPPAVRNDKARALADQIRVMKLVDPTLGLYAAYAYADANLLDKVRSVRDFMREDLRGASLFDVAMLAGDLAGKQPGDAPVYPFCPMLSQGWGYLRVKGVRLPEGVIAARDHLRQSLWLTLDPEGTRVVENALRSGRVA